VSDAANGRRLAPVRNRFGDGVAGGAELVFAELVLAELDRVEASIEDRM